MFVSCCREGSDNLGMEEGAPGSSELLLPQWISAQNVNNIPFFGGIHPRSSHTKADLAQNFKNILFHRAVCQSGQAPFGASGSYYCPNHPPSLAVRLLLFPLML